MKIAKKLMLPILLIFALLCGCAQAAATYQEQYDLGIKYLGEGNYEEAILSFTAAIEIDPKRAEAYIALADSYVLSGDAAKAERVLRDALKVAENPADIEEKLSQLTPTAPAEVPEEEAVAPENTGEPVPAPGVENASLTANGTTLTATLVVDNLQESYPVSQDGVADMALEYSWQVEFSDKNHQYAVGTNHWKEPSGAPSTATLFNGMQTDLWVQREDGGFSRAAEVDLTIDGNTLIWVFSIPEEYDFDYANMAITGVLVFNINEQ